MANTNLVHDLIMKEAHRTLRNNSVFVNALTARYDDSYSSHGAKAGSDIRIQVPQEFSVRTGKTIDVQDVEEKYVTISRSIQRGVDMKYSSAELTQDQVMGQFSKNKIEPAMATLAAYIDNYILKLAYKEVNQTVVLPTTALDKDDILNAGARLDEGSCPRTMDRYMILNPAGMADAVSSLSALFNNARPLSKNFDDGILSMPQLGFNFGMSQNIPSHTCGSYDGNYVVTSAPTEGTGTLTVKTGTGTFKEGDVIEIASVNQVNSLTKDDLGKKAQFVVTADSAGGAGDITVSPNFISTGPYQNISALPAADAVISHIGTLSTVYPQNLAFHNGFGAVGFCDLDIPRGVPNGAAVRKVEDGISLRLIDFYDGTNDDSYMRFDVLFGYKTINPRWACRVYGV